MRTHALHCEGSRLLPAEAPSLHTSYTNELVAVDSRHLGGVSRSETRKPLSPAPGRACRGHSTKLSPPPALSWSASL